MAGLILKEYVNSEIQAHRQIQILYFKALRKYFNLCPLLQLVKKLDAVDSDRHTCPCNQLQTGFKSLVKGLRAPGSLSIKLVLSVYTLCLLFRPFEWLLISCCWGVVTWTHDSMLPKTSISPPDLVYCGILTSVSDPWRQSPWFLSAYLLMSPSTDLSGINQWSTCRWLLCLTKLPVLGLWTCLWSIVSQTLLEHVFKE